MSYVTANIDPATRIKGVATTVAIHALLAAGVLAGLSITGVIADEDETMTSFFLPEEETPPPPPPVDQPPETEMPMDQPIAAPVPPVDLAPRPPVRVEPARELPNTVVRLPVPTPVPSSPAVELPPPTPTPSPAPAFTPAPPRPVNGPTGWITNDDYSSADLRREREGTASYRLVVGSDGRVDACEVTSSTGHASLDQATCRFISRRARFDPATDRTGSDVVGTYSGSVTWRIPE